LKLLLIDLDGTIRYGTDNPKGFVNNPTQQAIFPDAAKQLQSYYDRGWQIIGISNQGGIEKGYVSLDAVLQGMRQTINLAPQIYDIYFCPSFTPPGTEVYRCGYRSDTGAWGSLRVNLQNYPVRCGYRKPEPGMLLMAIEDCVCRPSEVLYVGDRPEDEQAAAAANIPFMWAENWRAGTDDYRDISAETLYLRLEDDL
jgi:D-glycero-D-manno-heptose 1,7-bisphosphate phosphatase